MSKFRRLCEIISEKIDEEKVSNPKLKNIFKTISKHNKGFIYHHMYREYTDKDHCEHSDQPNHGYNEYPDVHSEYSEEYKDHTDHTEHTEKAHNDNHYSESSYHTDSYGGHVDRMENKHTDVSK